MADRNITDFWFVWQTGHEWPEQFACSDMARKRAETMAKGNPGKPVYVGTFSPSERLLLPDELEVTKLEG